MWTEPSAKKAGERYKRVNREMDPCQGLGGLYSSLIPPIDGSEWLAIWVYQVPLQVGLPKRELLERSCRASGSVVECLLCM